MVVSRKHKFVYVRVPKTGSTSGLFYFMKSGLFDNSTDLYALDAAFNSWQEMYSHFKESGDNYLDFSKWPVDFKLNEYPYRSVHASFNNIVESIENVDSSYACYAGIRNPIDRICSVYFYEQKRRDSNNPPRDFFNYKDVNEFCYTACLADAPEKLKAVTRLQTSYFPEHARLWNTENFHEHAVADITALGGKVTERIHARHNNIRPKDYKALLSHEVIQMMELKYAQDFVLWEKAYAVYN